MSPNIILVKWLDITGHDKPWWTEEEAKSLRPAEITSVGLLLEMNDDYLLMAGAWEPDNDLYGNLSCIPRGVIQLIHHLPRPVLDPTGPEDP